MGFLLGVRVCIVLFGFVGFGRCFFGILLFIVYRSGRFFRGEFLF